MNYKLFLDDVRDAPDASWTVARTAAECIELLKTGQFTRLSLDHDLGDDIAGTGYNVACWLEERAAAGRWAVVPRNIGVHSANPPGRVNIEAAISSIDRFRAQAGCGLDGLERG